MGIFEETIERELPDLSAQGVQVRFIGRRDRAPAELQARMAALEDETRRNDRIDLWIAFDYGGRAELVDAARRLIEAGTPPEDVDEDAFAAALYAPELPDPDLLIRTSGELRISNFLLWQLAYSELVFVDSLWPDFGEGAPARALERVRAAAGAASAGDEQLLVAVIGRGRSASRSSLGLAVARRVVAVRARRRRRLASRCTSCTR